ncbi:MAG: TetR/AcrR family transcriptional regulator [Candidatus Nanohaloarchaeota archaeon QJJ-7]|nr:TetR/AcrR family transcriptional regulator [Candidatus Nanohaloarchaeota archaeon QJJ-7]
MGSERKDTATRQEEILEASLHIIHEEGQSKLTVRNIADRIGISEPAVYRHFDSKEEIVRRLAEKLFSADLLDMNPSNFGEPEDLLNDLLSSVFESIEENPHVTSFLFDDELFAEYPEVEQKFLKHRSEKREQLSGMIEAGQEQGFIDDEADPETAALVLMGGIWMTVREWREKGFDEPLENQAEDLAAELSRML